MDTLKPKAERLKETMVLLKKIQEVGVPKSHYVFYEVKNLLSAWVSDGPAVTQEIDFGSHLGELKLPVKLGSVATLNLKAKHK
jgi:hypothetical protein